MLALREHNWIGLFRDQGTVRLLLNNCLVLLEKQAFPEVMTVMIHKVGGLVRQYIGLTDRQTGEQNERQPASQPGRLKERVTDIDQNAVR